MTITPEYGEEGLMHEQEEEVERQAGSQLPPWEDLGETEVAEHEESERETQRPASGDAEPLRRHAGLDGEREDFDESPDGWAMELNGPLDEDAEPEKSIARR